MYLALGKKREEETMAEDPSDEREVLSAKISRAAADGWRGFCSANGISLTSMLEVAGLELGRETIPPTLEVRNRMVSAAREIDINRRSRKSKI